jgi:ureidoglycolate hydrolase
MVKNITDKNFRPFGHIIHHPQKTSHSKTKNLFRIVLKERGRVGWRIAYLIIRDKTINMLEQHPGTFESFEPVKGRTILYLAKNKDHNNIKCFYLDRPVILHKGVWHAVVTLDGESEIKITENASVKSHYWRLGFSLNSSHKKQNGK